MYKVEYAPGARESVCGPPRVKRTSLNLNMALVDRARKDLGTKTIKETVEAALWEAIAMVGRERAIQRWHSEPYDPALVEEMEEARRQQWNRGLEALDENCHDSKHHAG